jgi:predicted amidohydrolase
VRLQRRQFLTTAAGAAAAAATHAQVSRRYDLLIQNGDVRDPSRSFRAQADVAILDGKIAAIDSNIPAEKAREVIDARGLYVAPELVDIHTHCYWGGTGLGIDADRLAPRSGVTTWVDAGSFGYDTYPGFQRFIVEPSRVRIFAYVYLYPSSRNPDTDPVKYVRSMMKHTGETAAKNRETLPGVKFQCGSNMNGRYSLDFLKIAREICDAYKLPLMVHISFAPPETPEVMALMRTGDVITHCYNAHTPVYDMPTTMSKLLYLGMSFDDVLLRSTSNPARVLGGRIAGAGTLRQGGPADIAILEIEDGEFQLVDSQHNAVTAKKRIVTRLTICRKKLEIPL